MEIKHLIAHRGNISGANPEKENTIKYLLKALDEGFECEVDLWFIDNGFYLGHDSPNEIIDEDFLLKYSDFLWIHCKNIEALEKISGLKTLNYFWHENDKYTLTSKNFIWTYPGEKTGEKSIIVSLDSSVPVGSYIGICSDNIEKIKYKIANK